MKVFISYSSANKALFDAVAERLRERGDDVIEPSEKSVLKDIASEVSGSIRSADAIVAILGGENPNVYFELGLAAGANRAVVVAIQTPERMPVELKGMPFVQFAGDVLRDAPAIARVIATLPTSPVKKQSMFDSAEDKLRSVATDITALRR
jgi:hypothetical protein